MNKNKVFIAVASSVLNAILIDIRTFRKAREANPAAKFDFSLFSMRVGEALIVGLAVGGGLSMAAE